MKKQNLILVSLVVLLICNGFLLWRLYQSPINPPEGGPHPQERAGGFREGPRELIVQQLHFDESQQLKYDALIQEHRMALRKVNRETIAMKKELYASLLLPTNRDSIIQLIAQQQQKVEQINLSHFADIQKLCRPDQQDYFRELVGQLSQLFDEHHPPPQRPE